MIARDENGKFLTYAWPGGYPIFHLCADGEVICADCANDPENPVTANEKLAGKSEMYIRRQDLDPQWVIVASDINRVGLWRTGEYEPGDRPASEVLGGPKKENQ